MGAGLGLVASGGGKDGRVQCRAAASISCSSITSSVLGWLDLLPPEGAKLPAQRMREYPPEGQTPDARCVCAHEQTLTDARR